MPVAQKYIAGSGWPSGRVTARDDGAEGAVDAGLEHRDHRDDGQEDAGEQLGHLGHRPPGELVGGMHAGRRDPQRQQRDRDQADVAHQPRQADRRCRRRRSRRGDFQMPLSSTSPTIAASSQKLTRAVEADAGACRASGRRAARLPCGSTSGRARRTAPAATPTRNSVSGRMLLRGPEEVHALEEAEEQRRIAQRRERAADVRHDEDEEHDHVRLVAAVVVGADQRADQQHRGAGGAHQARQHRADRQDRRC